MNASETLAHALLAELRRFGGETALTARIAPMQWVAIAKEIGLSDKARGEAITYLRTKGYIAYKPETTEIIAFSPAGIELADQLIRQKPKISDPMPSTLEAICAELDYWESHLNDGEVGSNDWVKVKERIDGLRHRENRFRPSVSITNNAIGLNPRINQGSVDQSVNLVSQGGPAGNSTNETSESDLMQPFFREGDEPLGVFWSSIPSYIKKAPVSEIRLATGPTMWLRLIPAARSHVDLSLPMQVRQHLMSDGKLWLSPLNWEISDSFAPKMDSEFTRDSVRQTQRPTLWHLCSRQAKSGQSIRDCFRLHRILCTSETFGMRCAAGSHSIDNSFTISELSRHFDGPRV